MRKYTLKRNIVKGGAVKTGAEQDAEKGSRSPSVTPSVHVSRAAGVPLPVTPTHSISRSDRSQTSP